jgi:hypothetical protein
MKKHNPRIMFRSAVLQLEEFSHEICEPDRYGSIDFSHNLGGPSARARAQSFGGTPPSSVNISRIAGLFTPLARAEQQLIDASR